MTMTLTEIAQRINAHLKRFEADPFVNAPDARGLRHYYNAGARRGGKWVMVRYISYHGWSNLSREQAADYLAALDAGFVGTHYVQQRSAAQEAQKP